MSIVLVCRPKFYCDDDKKAFFEWLKALDGLERTWIERDIIYIELKSRRIKAKNLCDLIGFFYRNKLNMKQLAQFCTHQNKHWFFDDKVMFWHTKIFGPARSNC